MKCEKIWTLRFSLSFLYSVSSDSQQNKWQSWKMFFRCSVLLKYLIEDVTFREQQMLDLLCCYYYCENVYFQSPSSAVIMYFQWGMFWYLFKDKEKPWFFNFLDLKIHSSDSSLYSDLAILNKELHSKQNSQTNLASSEIQLG